MYKRGCMTLIYNNKHGKTNTKGVILKDWHCLEKIDKYY